MIRRDRGSVLRVDASPSTPARSSASRTDEGYLEADAYLARDGLLTYSDGQQSWQEYRPRAELEQAAASWFLTPVTDDHPQQLVDATNHSDVARGLVISQPVVVEQDGIAYLKARVRVTDSDLIRKLEAGEQREISIGFTADVHPERGTYDGVEYSAVQRTLKGNHVASVPHGRAGPTVRVLMDGSAQCSYYPKDSVTMATKSKKVNRTDEVGMPVTMSRIISPDGVEIEVPTWIAAALEELMQLKQQEAPVAPAEEAPSIEAAEAEAVSGDELPAPVEQAPPAEEEEKEKMSADSIQKLIKARARLERLADRAGLDPDQYADDCALAAAFVKTKVPTAKTDGLTMQELQPMVELAALISPPATNPFAAVTIRDSASNKLSPEVEAEIRFLRLQGVS